MKPYIKGTQLIKNNAVNDLGEREMLMFECDGTYWEQTIEIVDPDNVGWHLHVPVWIDSKYADNTVGEDGYLDGVGTTKVKLFLAPNKGNIERVRGGIFSDPILESEYEPIDIGFELIQHAQERKTFVDSYLPDYACSNKSGAVFIPTRCWSFNDFADITFDSDVDWITFDNIYRETEIETPTNGKGPWLFGGNTMKQINYWKKLAKSGDLKMVYQCFILTVEENESNESRVGHVNICGQDITIYQDGVTEKLSDFWFEETIAELSDNEVEIKCYGDGDVPEMYISTAAYEIDEWLKIERYTADDPKNQGHYKKGFHPSKGPGKVKLTAWPGENRISFLYFIDKNKIRRQIAIMQ